MIRIKLMDGNTLEIPREEAIELLPYRGVFVSTMLKSPIEGLLTHRGKLVSVIGPLPDEAGEKNARAEDRAWLLLLKGCAQVIRGLPQFQESASSNVTSLRGSAGASEAAGDKGSTGELLQELDQLLKAA